MKYKKKGEAEDGSAAGGGAWPGPCCKSVLRAAETTSKYLQSGNKTWPKLDVAAGNCKQGQRRTRTFPAELDNFS